MGVFDKIKNFFYDEEEVVVTKPAPTPPVKPSEVVVKKEEVKEERKKDKVKEPANVEDIVSERELFKSEPTFKFPVIFEDEDFVEEKRKNKGMNILDVEKTRSREVKPVVEEHKSFQPSPIISPIYGVLDKNYKKDDVTTKDNEIVYIHHEKEKVDLDSVIEKAYGNYKKLDKLEEATTNAPINTRSREKAMFYNLNEEKEEPIDLFKDIEEPSGKATKEQPKETNIKFDVDIEFENNYHYSAPDEKLKNIDELLEKTSDHDFYSLVDSMYKNKEEEESDDDGNTK